MKKRDFVELWTYGTYDEISDTDFGLSFEVPKKWLKQKVKEIGYRNLSEFFIDYIWDTTEQILNQAESDGVLLNKKCGEFGHLLYSKNIRSIRL